MGWKMIAGKGLSPYLLLLFALIYLHQTQANVISCGGFVKSSNTDLFPKIKIKLENQDGLTKFETELTPSNGYYMVPIYNHGSYAIRVEGPEGFVFNPSTVPITINGVDDPCTKGEDINFSLFGFTVSGKVRSGDLAGPSKLSLALYSEDNQQYATTVTDETGAYKFEASPGKYVVSTSDNTQQCVERGSVPVEVKDKPVVVVPDIRLSGHSLVASVIDDADKPLAGATILLVSDQNIPFDQQVNAPKPSVTQKNGKYEYRLLSDESGKAVFKCLSPNSYELSASWATKKTSLSFLPAKQTVKIASEPVDVTFQTGGFDVVGQVKLGSKPLSDVRIFVDGESKAVTDENGSYKVKALKRGRHTFEAKKEHYLFEKLSHEINIDNPTLPAIEVKKFEVCGLVKFDSNGDHSTQDTQINVLNKRGDFIEKLNADKNGKFCIFLEQGSYKFEPAKLGSRLKPDHIDVELKEEPVLDLIFTEFKATINGKLECFSQSECSNAKINLELNGREIDSVSLQQGNSFVFNDVLPGSYDIQVSGLDSICLDHETKLISVESSNLDVSFKQTGYRAQINSPIEAKLNWKIGSESGVQKLNANQNVFCLPKPGTYTFNFDTCYEFTQGKTLSHSLPTTEQLKLTVKSAHFSTSVSTDTNASPNDFKVQLKSGRNSEVNLTPGQSQGKTFSFTTSIDNKFVDQEFELVPLSEKFLFTPQKHTFNFDGKCSFDQFSFKASEGRFVTGSIEPSVANAAVTAKNKKDGSILTSKTDSKGHYKIGLVFNPDDYEVDFELEGYKFIPTDTKNKFKSIKLSKLTVTYADKTTKKELPDVLISLSGGDNYRDNKIVNQNGQITFVDLPTGEYFIRSVLREYQFDATSVKIKEGETVELKLFGVRHAWSAFGKVTTAGGGSPASQMSVEASSQNCKLQEDDSTDDKGNFRVRGLKPKCAYRIVLKDKSGTQISSIPPFIDVNAEEKDQLDLEFSILATVPLNEIVGLVQFDDDVKKPKSIRVELYENGALKTHEELTSGNLFIFSNVITPKNTYKLAINDIDLKNSGATSEPIQFTADQLTKNVILRVKQKEKKTEIETSTSNIFGIVFVLVSTFIAINVNYSKELLFNSIARARSVINQQRDSSPGADKRRKAKR